MADLRAYVLSGKEFPTTNDEFDKKLTKRAFKRLEEVRDPDIYAPTKKAFVDIGSTCSRFYNANGLHNIC